MLYCLCFYTFILLIIDMIKTKSQSSFLKHFEKYQKQLNELQEIQKEKTTNNSNFFKLILELDQNKLIPDAQSILFVGQISKKQESIIKKNLILQYRVGYFLWALTQNRSQFQLRNNYLEKYKKKQLQSSSNQQSHQLKFGQKQITKENNHKKMISQIIKFLKENRLTYSFDENIFTKQKSGFGYNPLYDDGPKTTSSKLSNQTLSKCKPLALLMRFLQKTQLLEENSFINQNFKRIGQESYKLQYLKEYCFFQPLSQKLFPNCQFYTNKKKHPSQRLIIDDLFYQKGKDYSWLQRCHNYIQWLFPNHFKSGFNDDCFPLSYLEAEIFKQDIEIGQRMLKSIQIYLDFMGTEIQYSSNKKVRISKVIGGQRRLEDVLINYTHNHLRLMRILACLSITGFRMIAVQLIKFLDQLTQNETKYKRIRKVFESKWQIYDDKMKQKAFQMCFLQAEQFPLPHQALNQRFLEKKNKLQNISTQIKSQLHQRNQNNKNRNNQKTAKSQFKFNQKQQSNGFKKQSNQLAEKQSKNNQNFQSLNLQEEQLDQNIRKTNQNKVYQRQQYNRQNYQSQFRQNQNSEILHQKRNKLNQKSEQQKNQSGQQQQSKIKGKALKETINTEQKDINLNEHNKGQVKKIRAQQSRQSSGKSGQVRQQTQRQHDRSRNLSIKVIWSVLLLTLAFFYWLFYNVKQPQPQQSQQF